MKRTYSTIVCEGWNQEGGIEQSLAWKTYFLDDGTIGRIDYHDPKQGLFKVSYRHLEPPYDAILEEHWKEHPGVMCEFATPVVIHEDGSRVIRTHLYQPGNILDRQYEVHLDEQGKTIRQIKIGADGQRLREERPVYDDNGLQIGTNVYNAQGRFLYLDDYDAEW